MAENVQCPVCTLYLHAGMNLSDHLETHPKEQVIKALVQMTISGGGIGSNNVLASVLAGGGGGGGASAADASAANDTKKSKSTSAEVEEKHLPNDKNNDLMSIASTNNSCSAISISNSASNCSLSNQSTASSQNSNNAINFNTTTNSEQTNTGSEQERTAPPSPVTPLKKSVKIEHQNMTPNLKEGKFSNQNVNEGFDANKQGFSQTSSTGVNQAYHASSEMELPNSSNNHINFTVFGGNQRYEQHHPHQQQQQQQQHRSSGVNQNQLHAPHMPPPPPPQPAPSQQTEQHTVGQQQEISRTSSVSSQITQQSIATASTSGSFHTLQQQQQQLPPPPLPPPPPPHHSSLGNAANSHRQSHLFSGQHHQQQPPNSHHQQNLKVIYAPALPPPPPLQLFTYQPPTHLQHHQKPPPAYGTAISQIRSQHNQNKHHATGSSLVTQHQHPTTLQTHASVQHHHQQQQHLQQQQQQQHLQQQALHHNLRIHVPPPPPPPIPTKHLYTSKTNELAAAAPPSSSSTSSSSVTITSTRHNHQQQQHQQQQNKSGTEQQPQQQHHHHQHHQPQPNSSDNQQQTQNLNYHGLNTNDLPNKITKGSSSTTSNANSHTPTYPQVSISPSIASASMAAVAAASTLGGRHTNSPFAALLAAAAGAPSPSNASSSVLRYAESPVAHYLERDNGDFIVQETPKHIVECVEKDNGEFSVIERIYQSPPSVLHIHDDDEDEEDDEDNDDDDRHDNVEENEDNFMASDDHEEKDLELKKKATTMDDLTSNTEKSFNKMSIDTKKSNRKLSKHARGGNNASNENEIVDFVSISSDSEDEEFISHERKEHTKNTTEKCKKQEISATPLSSSASSSSSTLLMSTSTLSSPTTTTSSSLNVGEHHLTGTPSTISSSHSSASLSLNSQTHQSASTSSGGRKKSSKNTVTVLSDVQLNLNEYLDLVGNIIASSKVAAQRKTFATLAPIPMVKIEKEEPVDDYVMTTTETTTTMITSDTTTICNNLEQPTTPPPLKANKHETDEFGTDKPSGSNNKHKNNNHNISLNDELHHKKEPAEDVEELKPQVVLENNIVQENGQTEITSSISISNSSTSLKAAAAATINKSSSHVTSVIRMATTSQQHINKTQNDSSPTEAEDLSQPQRKNQLSLNAKSSLATPPLQRKGPKKLVIKPKSSKTEVSTATRNQAPAEPNDQPTTSAKAATINEEGMYQSTDQVQVKNEPLTSITYESHQYQGTSTTGFSILEQHLSSKDPLAIMECKEEKPCITETSLSTTIKEMKVENNVNDDARVLYDFANSKKATNSNNAAANMSTPTTPTFPSSTSLFSNNLTAIDHENSNSSTTMLKATAAGNTVENKNINKDLETLSYSSQSAMDARISSGDHTEENSTTAPDDDHNPQNQVFTDFPFSYLYNGGGGGCNMAEQQVDIKNHQQFTTFYQNVNPAIDDSSSSKQYRDCPLPGTSTSSSQQALHHQQQHQHHHWFGGSNNQSHYQTSDVNNIAASLSNHSAISNLNSSLSVDGGGVNATTALDNNDEVGKYLDLDTCKREQNIDAIVGDGGHRVTVPPPPPPSSSTSCSYTGTGTDNSMAGICSTAATLNIRTDEKMPAKGEISEQESNCDIDNSWSQPMYGDISARFFKTTFPGIFPQDNGWNHDDYFTVQDLSASTTAQATNANNRMKSFEFRLPLDANSTGGTGGNTSNSNSNNNSGLPIFSQNSNDNCNIDVMPSTSAKIRKRRKRNSQDGAGKTTQQTNAKRMQPTSTITSQQMLLQHHQDEGGIQGEGVDFNFQQPQQQQQQQLQLQNQQHLQQPSTSTAFLAGPSNASSSSSIISTAASSTSSFMLPSQQQQQQQQQTQQKQRTKIYECGHCNAKYSKLKDRNAHMIDVHNYIRQNRRLVCPTTGLATPLTNADMQDVALPTTSAASSILMPSLQNADCMAGDCKQGIVKIENENIARDLAGVEPINADLRAKTEIMEDDKQNVSLVPISSAANSSSNLDYVDTKPPTNSLPLSLTTPTSKLTTLYRMLVSFNMTTLKQNQSLSEFDENLIKSSIFFCYICRQNFNSVKLYDAHLTEHPAECFTCGKKFQRWKNFSLHLKRHLGWKEFGCTVCDKKFVVRSALVEHMRMHSGLSPLKCKVCGKHFKRYSNLTQHRKRHTKQIIRRKEYVCYCGEVLPSKARFLWHKETHDSKPKCCPHCCDRFVHVNSLRRHIRLAHSDKFDYTEPMECPICKQIFAKASMKAHMATHSTETQYDCAICSKSFSTKWNLKIHSWVHANRTSKPFKCEHCPKAFVREVDFKNHMNSHKQIKPYTCEVCGCKFIRKYNYMRHRREHHGNKKYTCDLCKKSFHRHYYLIEHRRIHTGERPFQCTICGKSSTTKTNHNKHLKIHHSRDPFTVEV